MDTDNETALRRAAAPGYTANAEVLISHGANINHQMKTGDTALMEACTEGQETMVKLLLDNGADSYFLSNLVISLVSRIAMNL